jgi:hypothetical protein
MGIREMSNWVLPVLAGLALFSLQACAQDGKHGLSDSQIRQRLVDKSIREYAGECPCPESRTSSGKKCGKNSAYSRAGGSEGRPLCYPSNVSATAVRQYRNQLAKP